MTLKLTPAAEAYRKRQEKSAARIAKLRARKDAPLKVTPTTHRGSIPAKPRPTPKPAPPTRPAPRPPPRRVNTLRNYAFDHKLGPTGLTGKALIIQRLLALDYAKNELIPFVRLGLPVPDFPDDPTLSRYDPQAFHMVIAAALEEVEKGNPDYKRLIITLPPRHGKTEIASKRFIPWYVGRNPLRSVIFATYNEKFGEDIGRAVRDNMRDPSFRQVFPDVVLKSDSQASDRLEVTYSGMQGGVLAFVGRGGTTTGRGADLIIIDDPLKDRAEADSPAIRERLWSWFTQVIGTRLMDDTGAIVVIQTRWHRDDIVGRLTDEHNEQYDPDEAKRWKIIDIPALAGAEDVLGRREGEALWPSRFNEAYLEGMNRQDPRGFSALYQGRPTPPGGMFFQDEWLIPYKRNQLPKNLRMYAASDHAVSLKQGKDFTCLMPCGVDEDGDIWILPDVIWRQMSADAQVDAMLNMMKERKPLFWWAERSQISKSIGPFLRKRMLEEHTFCSIIEVIPLQDKMTRAQSIQGRMAMKRVHFPEFAPWWPRARDEILSFPLGQHDDFVDALAFLGLGLQQMVPSKIKNFDTSKNKPKEGTFGFLKKQRKESVNRPSVAFGFQRLSGW